MGIKAGTTITVTFNAEQIAQLDCLLQEAEMYLWDEQSENDRYELTRERVDNIYRALHTAGYR